MPTSHLLWLALVVTNLAVQILSFLRGGSQPLHWAKKVTTPLLLFAGFLILWHHSGTAFSVASTIRLAMGVGEIGMEGSNVVASRGGSPAALERWAVAIAGLLFLLGAGFDRTTRSGKRNLLILMVVILLLYYLYMGVLISTGSPFRSGSPPLAFWSPR